MSTAGAMGAMFGVECTNCGGEADLDVRVLRRDDGSVVRDIYACEGCAGAIDVPAAFAVATEEL